MGNGREVRLTQEEEMLRLGDWRWGMREKESWKVPQCSAQVSEWNWQPLITTGNQEREQVCKLFRCEHTKVCYNTEILFLSPNANSTSNLPEYTDLGLKPHATFSLPQNCSPAPAPRVSLPSTGSSRPTTDPLSTL